MTLAVAIAIPPHGRQTETRGICPLYLLPLLLLGAAAASAGHGRDDSRQRLHPRPERGRLSAQRTAASGDRRQRAAGLSPGDLRCEWKREPDAVRDTCPEFDWTCPRQSAYRIVVEAPTRPAQPRGRILWDSDRVPTTLPVAEYAGPPLQNATTYTWRLQAWDDTGKLLPSPPIQSFSLDTHPMPHHLPTIRTFINFAGRPAFAGEWLDMCFHKDAKQARPDILTVRYGLVCTLVLPHPESGRPLSGKAKELADYCVQNGLTSEGIAEGMFCHFAEDTKVRLHVGAERAANPVEERVCPGWDPRNDRDDDGRVDDAEFANLANPRAHARHPRDARIPIYYWGPPNDDFVMNVGHPAYQDFMANVHAPQLAEGYDGIYFDTVPPHVPGPGMNGPVLEYPPRQDGQGTSGWLRDLQVLLAGIKRRMPDTIITGNAWDATPMVMDGLQSEGWQRLGKSESAWRTAIDVVLERDRRGKIQMIQYNPAYHPELSEFGEKLPVTLERDQMFGLATYLLAHGDYTYYGFGRHPYGNVTHLWFEAMKVDLGTADGDYFVYATTRAQRDDAPNLLENGGFESEGPAGKPAAWTSAEPVQLDREVKHTGESSARISSPSSAINNMNKQFVTLEPATTYTLTAWVKTASLDGSPGAQVYPYEFDGTTLGDMLTWHGTGDWKEQALLFRTAEDAHGRITFRVYKASGTAWFDDIRLVEGDTIGQRVFARRYSGGLVLVKPCSGDSLGEDTRTTHRLPSPHRPLHADGTVGDAVGEISLRSGEAAVLVRCPE